MKNQVILVIICSVIAISDAVPPMGWSGDGKSPEALYMRQASRTGFSGNMHMMRRPGHPTKTHTCNHIRQVPEDLRDPMHMRPDGLDDFYQKYTEAYGIPIVSSEKVSDDALKRACYVVRFLLADSARMRHEFYKIGGRLALISTRENITDVPEYSHMDDWWNERARGLGATLGAPLATAAEENALCWTDLDSWANDDIVLHEYLHALHALGANLAYTGFEQKVKDLYNDRMADGRWNSTYSSSTEWEYFAEAGQSYLNAHKYVSPPPNGIHNHVATREALKKYDRDIHDIHENEIFTCHNHYIHPCKGNKSSAQRRAQEHRQVLKMDCDGSTVPTAGCEDRSKYCHGWKKFGMCESEKKEDQEMLKKDCKETCGFC